MRMKLMEEIVIQIIRGILINVDVSVRSAMYVKKLMFGILLHAIGPKVRHFCLSTKFCSLTNSDS